MCPYSRECCGHHGPPDVDQKQRLMKKRSPKETWGLTEEDQAGGGGHQKVGAKSGEAIPAPRGERREVGPARSSWRPAWPGRGPGDHGAP